MVEGGRAFVVVFWIVVPVLWLVFIGPNLLHWVSQWLGGR
jgi:hypothetical protein